MNKLFENKTMVISGGLGDIGQAISIAFAKLGAAIALGDLHAEADANRFLEKLRQEYGTRCRYNQVDAAQAGAVEDWLDEVENNLGTPTIVIANAATVTQAGILDISPEQWSDELRVNLDGAFHLSQKAARRIISRNLRGHVLFIGSWAAHAVHPGLPAYCVSKAGMRMLCKCMALELAPHGILVNEIAPGYVAAGLSGKIWESHPGQKEQAAKKVPLKKVMSAKSVALQAVHLCHPDSEHMTGSTLLLDGGLSLLS